MQILIFRLLKLIRSFLKNEVTTTPFSCRMVPASMVDWKAGSQDVTRLDTEEQKTLLLAGFDAALLGAIVRINIAVPILEQS